MTPKRFHAICLTLAATLLAGLLTALIGSSSASAHDVSTTPGTFMTLTPTRVLDTGTKKGASANIPAFGSVAVQISGIGGVPSSGVSAVTLNLQAVNPTSNGYLTLHADGTSRPNASNLNFTKSNTISTLAVAPISGAGAIRVYNGSPTAIRVIADLAGYYVAGVATAPGTFTPMTPARLLDTARGTGPAKNIPAKGSMTLQVTGRSGVPSAGVASAVLNLQAVTPGTAGYLTLHAAGTSRPAASSLTFSTGTTISTLAVAPLSTTGSFTIYNGSATAVRVIADLAGYHLAGNPAANGAFVTHGPKRVYDTWAGGDWTGNIPARGTIEVPVGGVAGIPTTPWVM